MPNGRWFSSNSTVATVDETTGVVTALSLGTTTVTYTVDSCTSNGVTVTVSTTPKIDGEPTRALCSKDTATFSADVSGGSWSSSNTSVATINPTSGLVTAINAGTTTITYTVGSCVSQGVGVVVTVANTPTINGDTSIALCSGTTRQMTSPQIGGEWKSNNSDVASVNKVTGLVTAVSAGVASIRYTVGSCVSDAVDVKVFTTPTITGGVSSVCIGEPSATADRFVSNVAGVWLSNDITVLTISETGRVTGIKAGSASVTFRATDGSCVSAPSTVVVKSKPTISGPTTRYLCSGASLTLSSDFSAGEWKSSDPSVATVTKTTGLVTALTAGSTVITFTTSDGSCVSSGVTVVVDSTPVVSGGVTTLCIGETAGIPFISTISAGRWSVSPQGGINSAGFLTGVSAGMAVVVFTADAGSCPSAPVSVSIKPTPAISGGGFLCSQRRTITLSAAVGGVSDSGTWAVNSGAVTLSTAGPSSTVNVTYVSAGSATVTFTSSTGCVATRVITASAACSSIDVPETTCAQVRDGTAVALPVVVYSTLRRNAITFISETNPTTFFYDSFVFAPAPVFTLCILQNSTAGWPELRLNNFDTAAEFVIWSDSCSTKIASTG